MNTTPTYRVQTNQVQVKFEYRVTALCFDGLTRESVSIDLIADSEKVANQFISNWNRQGREKYFYKLTGVTKVLTREEVKNLSTYEGSTRLYIKKGI
jgi:hypothetical protein